MPLIYAQLEDETRQELACLTSFGARGRFAFASTFSTRTPVGSGNSRLRTDIIADSSSTESGRGVGDGEVRETSSCRLKPMRYRLKSTRSLRLVFRSSFVYLSVCLGTLNLLCCKRLKDIMHVLTCNLCIFMLIFLVRYSCSIFSCCAAGFGGVFVL